MIYISILFYGARRKSVAKEDEMVIVARIARFRLLAEMDFQHLL